MWTPNMLQNVFYCISQVYLRQLRTEQTNEDYTTCPLVIQQGIPDHCTSCPIYAFGYQGSSSGVHIQDCQTPGNSQAFLTYRTLRSQVQVVLLMSLDIRRILQISLCHGPSDPNYKLSFSSLEGIRGVCCRSFV